MSEQHVTLIPTVRVYSVRYLEDDVHDGEVPRESYDNASHVDYDVSDSPFEEAVRVIEREGLTFAATGNDWAANPDGSVIVNYATGEVEEVTAHLIGFTEDDARAVVERVG